MRISQLAQRSGVSVKAVRYYERIGLIKPGRSGNGYRDFNESHVRIVEEIRKLSEIGIGPNRAAPFVECLDLGHEHGDECVSSLAVYRDTIGELDRMITSFTFRRDVLQQRLDVSASRTFHQENPLTDYTMLPDNLPIPEDDGAASHLPGMALPRLKLTTSEGRTVDLSALGTGRTVIYLYPLTGRPGIDLPEGWDAIPGARGCSAEACSFRNHFQDLQIAGAAQVFGMSSQSPEYQAEVVERLSLPFAMLSDENLALADALNLPTFSAPGHDRLYARLTLVVRDGTIERVFYPIFPPNTHAQQVRAWLAEHPIGSPGRS